MWTIGPHSGQFTHPLLARLDELEILVTSSKTKHDNRLKFIAEINEILALFRAIGALSQHPDPLKVLSPRYESNALLTDKYFLKSGRWSAEYHVDHDNGSIHGITCAK